MNLTKILKVLYTLAIIYDPVSATRNKEPHFTFRRGTCMDFCAKSIAGLPRHDMVQLTSHCSSYLSTSIASTVVTATSTATITQFNNNGEHNSFPSQPMLQAQETKTTWTGTDGILTVAPTDVPNKPFHWPACWPRKHGEEPFTTQFSSVCACQGVTPVTTSVAALTTTVTEQHTTIVSLFKLKALFKNSTTAYLEPKKVPNFPFGTNLTGQTLWVMSFDANKNGSSLFALTPEKNLIFESGGFKGWRPASLGIEGQNGELVGFLQEENEQRVDEIAPRYYIDVENKPGEGHALVHEERDAGQGGFFAVGIPGFELMWFGREKSVMDLPSGHEPVQIFAEPVF